MTEIERLIFAEALTAWKHGAYRTYGKLERERAIAAFNNDQTELHKLRAMTHAQIIEKLENDFLAQHYAKLKAKQ